MATGHRRTPNATPPLADPAEAVERIVGRRKLLFEDGDVIIVHVSGGLKERRPVYQLRIRGSGPVGERFVGFEHAVAAGEQIAATRQVRLFYVASDDTEHDIPYLLKDYRPAHA